MLHYARMQCVLTCARMQCLLACLSCIVPATCMQCVLACLSFTVWRAYHIRSHLAATFTVLAILHTSNELQNKQLWPVCDVHNYILDVKRSASTY